MKEKYRATIEEALELKEYQYLRGYEITEIDENHLLVIGRYETPCGCSDPDDGYICCERDEEFEITIPKKIKG